MLRQAHKLADQRGVWAAGEVGPSARPLGFAGVGVGGGLGATLGSRKLPMPVLRVVLALVLVVAGGKMLAGVLGR